MPYIWIVSKTILIVIKNNSNSAELRLAITEEKIVFMKISASQGRSLENEKRSRYMAVKVDPDTTRSGENKKI